MMKRTILILFTLSLFVHKRMTAQENEKKINVNLSGYVRNDFFFDSRQTVSAREGQVLLFPAPESNDINGNDINAQSNLNFLSIQSRISLGITGPKVFGANTSGLIEGDFLGQSNENISLVRLRHAFIRLSWPTTEIQTGQYWNPLFVTGCFPGTVSFNTGTPFQSFARNPQIRITQSIGNLKLIGAALSQRDYASRGPSPGDFSSTIASSQFLRNSSTPDLHLQLHYSVENPNNNNGLLFGAGTAYKTIVPRLSSEMNNLTYKVDEKVSGITAMAFTKMVFTPLTIKLQGRYGENIADLLSISGFAVKNIAHPRTGERAYTPLRNMTLWGEIHSNGDVVELGIFGGYQQNLGTKEEMSNSANEVFGLGTNIETLYRISPRVIYNYNNYQIGAELEYTSASYGSDFDVNYIPENTTTVANTRILLSAKYSF